MSTEALLRAVWDWARKVPSLATLVVIGSLGLFCAWGYSSFARADDLKKHIEEFGALKTQVKEGRIETLEGQLFDAKVSQCAAQNSELRKLYAKRVATLQAKYKKLSPNEREFSLPECGDL